MCGVGEGANVMVTTIDIHFVVALLLFSFVCLL